jgi:hypothetical protein
MQINYGHSRSSFDCHKRERNGSGMNVFTCLRIEYGVFQSEVLCPLLLVIAGMGVVDAVLRAQVGVA